MPYKANEARRHRIPRARYKVGNWPEYDRALQHRGSLTVWVTPEALAAWHPPKTGRRGRSPQYAAVAIETGHLLRLADLCTNAPNRRLPRRVNLPDALQYLGHCPEFLVGQSLDRRDLIRIGPLAPYVPHHVLLACWQAEALNVSANFDQGSATVCLTHDHPSDLGRLSPRMNARRSWVFWPF